MTATDSLLSLRRVSKGFGKIKVLHDIDLDIGPNEIVALVGDNGAGKSTLIKVITGVHSPSSGEVWFKGARRQEHSVKRSREIGIETVYQERALADQQALWRNMFAGRELTNRFGFIDVAQQKAETERLLRRHMGFTSKAITVDSEVRGLSGGEKQGVAIGRALYFDADLIILDEPTMGLSLKETSKVLDFVKDIRRQGKSAIFIDHNIFHVYDVSDRFVILDRGRIAGDFRKQDLSQDELVHKMLLLATTGSLEGEGSSAEGPGA
ncbi:ATP-binding cassette domain-containing protein [Pelagibius sp.]|uniref:ATP-binding cassette domain-containing protein n=1 Tax=Pelagibius sp. TaxID=1931238 RepID=UPI002628191B|nr:ATP-binding cassette domain-containing protein [Pelagibius sp.]